MGKKVAAAAAEAQEYADRAAAMGKVTNLYNLTLRQALPTQRPMLLASVRRLRGATSSLSSSSSPVLLRVLRVLRSS